MGEKGKGMIRQMDMLGRIVIPREVRKTMRLNYGDLLEIVDYDENSCSLRKYFYLRDISDLLQNVVNIATIGKRINLLIFDKEKYLATSCPEIKKSTDIGTHFQKLLDNRKEYDNSILENVKLTTQYSTKCYYYFTPIINKGDLLGGLVIFGEETISQINKNISKEIIQFLERYYI